MENNHHTGPNIIDLHDQVMVLKTNQIGLVIDSEIITVVYVQSSGMQKTKVTEHTVKFTDQSVDTFLSHELEHNDDSIGWDCDECYGEGFVEVMNCHDQSNECCGGCYKEIQCDQCNGTGTVEKLISDIIE
tara:strand:+ start:958 stop:1350 length:393 start_codon:yes stop_codon:yes gene_type:complete